MEMIFKVIYILNLVGGGVYFIALWMNALIKRHKFVEFLVKIVEFDVKVQTTGLRINYQRYKKKMVRRLLFKYFAITLQFSSYVTIGQDQDNGTDLYVVLGNSLGLVYVVVSLVFSIQLVELVLILKDRFQLLNNRLEKIVKYCSSETSFVEKTIENRKLFLTLSKICTLHHHLSKLIKLFNDIFGLILLSMIATVFIVITVMIFLITGYLQAMVIPWIFILKIAAVTLLYGINLISICHACYSTIQEVK
jgi:hypothetical protein